MCESIDCTKLPHDNGWVYPQCVKRLYCYFFYNKHHKPNRDVDWPAQWLPIKELSHDEEFSVFRAALESDSTPDQVAYYGVLPSGKSAGAKLRVIGSRGQIVAKFWKDGPFVAWHGFPMYPFRVPGRKMEPVTRMALKRMLDVGLINEGQFNRLKALS